MRRHIITYFLLPVLLLLGLWLSCQFVQKYYGIRYQVSASMPKGWYWVDYQPQPIHVKTLVIFRAQPPYENFLLQHHYVPDNGELLKEIIAVPDDKLCIQHQALWVNGKKIVDQSQQILNNPTIPKEKFCGNLANDEYAVLGPYHPRSYDSRYFGPIKKADIIGVAHKL